MPIILVVLAVILFLTSWRAFRVFIPFIAALLHREKPVVWISGSQQKCPKRRALVDVSKPKSGKIALKSAECDEHGVLTITRRTTAHARRDPMNRLFLSIIVGLFLEPCVVCADLPCDPPKSKQAAKADDPLSIEALMKLGAKLKTVEGHVVEVSLQSMRFTDDDLAFLEGLPHLGTLNLYETPITDSGLRRLKSLTSLRSLNLGFCRRITDAGVKYLKDLTLLESLNLGFCRKITDDGFLVLKQYKNVRTLNLSITSFGDERAELLSMMSKLENVDLDNTRVTDAGLKHLSQLKKLRYLRLVGTQVTDHGLENLTELPRLRFIHLRDTNVTDAGVAALQKALPNCKIRY